MFTVSYELRVKKSVRYIDVPSEKVLQRSILVA